MATLTSDEVSSALGELSDRAFTLTGRPVAKWAALELISHVEARLLGYDPGCNRGCPWCR